MPDKPSVKGSRPPIAPKHPHKLVKHGDERVDPYYWLRDNKDPEVIAYLEAENTYTQTMMKHTEDLQLRLYEEMLGRIKETDMSLPFRYGEYHYYERTEAGKAYGIFCRKQGSLEAEEQILLDQNQLAAGHEYFSLGNLSVSPDHKTLAYSVDTDGSERYTLYFLDLNTLELYPETIENTYYSLAWANDSRTVFYTVVDAANRPFQLWRHQIDHDPDEEDTLIFHESDEAFYLSVESTRSHAYILLSVDSSITSEVHYLNADDPTGSFRVLQRRLQGVEYAVEHHSDQFYIVTNDQAVNFRLVKVPVSSPTKPNWQEVIPHREDVLLEEISAFANHLVIYERRSGLPTVRVWDLNTQEEHQICFPEPTYDVEEDANPEFHTTTLRLSYTSLITPESIFDFDMVSHELQLKKQMEILGGYNRADYESRRLYATASDGTQIPISLVYKPGIPLPGPLLLTGYGSYGFSYPVTFSSTRLSLLDRGLTMAIAHIRGGSEMGRLWYENGKFLYKKNTFADFISCTEYLIQEGWTTSDQLAIVGGSAGGLLIGNVVNQRPDLFKVAVADVPFVDVVTTILDTSLPLSAMEWEEWGDPTDPAYYRYIKSYSPYDNVEAKAYPHLLILAGLNDPRVKYWEPAKWAAKIRSVKTDNNLLLLKTNMGAGHGGASGRYERLKERAFEYAFILDRLGVSSVELAMKPSPKRGKQTVGEIPTVTES